MKKTPPTGSWDLFPHQVVEYIPMQTPLNSLSVLDTHTTSYDNVLSAATNYYLVNGDSAEIKILQITCTVLRNVTSRIKVNKNS